MVAVKSLRVPIEMPRIFNKVKEHFSLNKLVGEIQHAYQPYIAQTRQQCESSFAMRYEVFNKELNIEPDNKQCMIQDEFDDYSIITLLTLNDPFRYCGTVRIVEPWFDDQLLPIEVKCGSVITDDNYHPSKFNRDEICELSQLAIPRAYRNNVLVKNDTQSNGNQLGVEGGVGGIPVTTICLYLSAAAIVINSGRTHTYVMAYPAFAKKLAAIGINLSQIGDVIDFNGKRAPFYINASDIHITLKSAYRPLFSSYLDYFSNVENI